MKKTMIPLFSLVLVFSLLFSIATTAAATPLPPPPPPTTPSLPEPTVTPVSGDMEFTTTFIPISQFPGTTEFNQMLVPVGFPAGEAQYQGDGVIVSGMDSGKATACFTITGTQYGWGGKVGVWNGTKWVLLATTIKNLEESPNSMACATITGNGTYAFIRFVADVSLLPVNSTCNIDTSVWSLSFDEDNSGTYFYTYMGNLPDGTTATITFKSANPTLNYWGFTGTTSTTVGNFMHGFADFYGSHFETDGPVLVTVEVTAAGCSALLSDYVINEGTSPQ
jgi:hypothetical protein